MHHRTFAVIALIASLTTACASAPPLRVDKPDHGSVADRIMAVQESFYAIALAAKDVPQAHERMAAYCAENREALVAMRDDSRNVPEAEQESFAAELERRTRALMSRLEADYEDEVLAKVAQIGGALQAMFECLPPVE